MVQSINEVGEDVVQAQTFLTASIPVPGNRQVVPFSVNSRTGKEYMRLSQDTIMAEGTM